MSQVFNGALNTTPPTGPQGTAPPVLPQQAMDDPFHDLNMIGDVDDETVQEGDINDHYANLAEFLTSQEIAALTYELMDRVNEDETTLEPFLRVHAQMLEELGFDRQYDTRDD